MTEIDRGALVEAIAELVRTPSINPSLVPGADGERAIAEQIAERLRRTPGIEVELQDSGDGRPNVIASAGIGSGRTLMINGHIDTVGVAGMAEPYSGRVEGNRLYGRGALDMKGAMGGALVLLEAVAGDPSFPGRLIVAFVTDEEHSSIGTQAVCREIERFRPDAAIVVEPSGLNATIAHKGFAWAEIVTYGFAAHGSDWEHGVDAIAHMGRVIGALEAHSRELLTRERHPIVGPPSLHLSLIGGGQELSSYPDRCRLEIERRTIPGESEEQVRAELQAILDRLATEDDQFKADLTMGLFRSPWSVSRDEQIVQVLAATYREDTGAEIVYDGAAGWMDTALLGDAGVPAVVFGPDGDGAHAVVEWADLDSVERYTRILAKTAYAFCGAG
ncbi:MAG TPA: M20/M25/M40 family metallo-hydrolase [Thermomicrobiales bacterium]|nr:M20/M25/M40 family metallo-hydrolase [Thermomicrobiales bacterium]